jgi:hypothetical protein
MPIGTGDDGAVRRAGLLVTVASLLVAATTLVVVGVAAPSTGRTILLLALVVVAFGLAAWRAIRARRDTTPTAGLRSLMSWAAAFSWAATLFAVLVALGAPGSGGRAVVAGVLGGCLLVLVGRAAEHRTSREL